MKKRTHILGSMIGGAVGYALGAAVEFMSLGEIRRTFGAKGIRDYAPAYGRLGAITDDTQMTLFTAGGLMRAQVRLERKGICNPVAVVRHAYMRWLLTQAELPPEGEDEVGRDGWLFQVPALWSRRAPGNTCLTALAIALFNLGRRWSRPGGGWSSLLDYQVPLKARQADVRICKIDLLGVTDQGRLVIIELKVDGAGGRRSDSPIAALMEGLRYAAIVQAELTAIANEAERCFGTKIAMTPPIVQLLAPRAWWCVWLNLKPAGDWAPALHALVAEVEACTGATIESMACDNGDVTYGADGRTPQLDRVPSLYPVRLNDNPVIGNPL